MFAKDVNILNDIYNSQIIKESVGLGPVADEPVVAPIRTCLRCEQPKPACGCEADEEEDMMIVDEPGEADLSDRVQSAEYDETNARMAKQQLFRIAKMSFMLHDIICDNEELAPWLADKIGRSYDGLNSVFAYKDYEQYREELDNNQHVEEGSDRDLIGSIDRAGSDILSLLRKRLQKESVEAVEQILIEAINVLESKKKK